MIIVYKAMPLFPEGIPDLELKATEYIPAGSIGDEGSQKVWFSDQAKSIADALYASLPGGTLDALLVELLDRKRSLLRVKA